MQRLYGQWINKNYMSIQINNPCTANWEQMMPAEKGRHCDTCAKTVYDFTQYTDQELLDFLSKQKGEVCGRVQQSALANAPVHQGHTSIWSRWIMGFVAFLGIQNAHSQGEMRHSRELESPLPPPEFKQSATDTSFKFTLAGGAMHEDTGVYSILVNTVLNRHFFYRNDSGVFEFEIPKMWFDSVLQFSFFDKKNVKLGSYRIPIKDAWKYYDSRILYSALPEAKIVVDLRDYGHPIVMGSITQPYGCWESIYKTSHILNVAPDIQEAKTPQNNQGKIPVHVSGKVNNGTHDIPGIPYVPAAPIPEY